LGGQAERMRSIRYPSKRAKQKRHSTRVSFCFVVEEGFYTKEGFGVKKMIDNHF